MILSAIEIKKFIASGEIIITPFDEGFLKNASYTFTLGNTLRKLKQKEYIDASLGTPEVDEFTIDKNGYLLQPGEFIIAQTQERLKLGNAIACMLSMRGSIIQTGLDALQTDTFCEPGFDGQLSLRTINNGPLPIKILPGVGIVKGIFIRVI